MFLFVKFYCNSKEAYCFKSDDYVEVTRELDTHVRNDLKDYDAILNVDKEREKQISYTDGENGVWMDTFYIYYKIIEVIV